MQKNPSFSATAKEAAEKRFPEGTVDWFLSSDFNVDYESVKVLDLIAKGSYGTVYKALWNGEVVAAKLEDFTDGDEEQVNLLVELTMLQSFPHERLVRFLGAGCLSNDQGSYIERKLMIVMEYCERGALRECLREKLPWNLRTRISLDICHGISFLHDNSIIHRDIKSTNVLIDSAWRAKLCDFSFACHNDSTSKKDLTYGTDEFMSPEVACALDFDMSADIFSYGIVLCEIITGKEPSNQFMCRKPQDLFALNEKEVKNVVLGDCPPQLEALAFACCDIEPRKRPTANICSEELTEILNNLGGPEFEYVPPDKAKLPNSPNPFREGKVRISVGGPGHENDNGRYGVNTPQGRRSFLSDDQLNNRLLELEKQVVELKEENLKLHNMVHKLSPILGSHNDLKDGIAVVSSHRNSNISTPDDVNRTWHSVYSNSSSNSTLNDLAGYEPNTIHTRLSILEQKIRIIYDANMISPVRDMILDDDDDGLMNKSLSETFLMEESDELGANKDGDNSMVLSSESLKNELRQVYKLKSQIDSITNNLEQKVITAVKSRKPNHFTTPSNKLSKGNATNNRTPITTNITKSKENDDPYENPNTVRPRLWPNSSLKKNENHTTKPPRHSVSSVESNKSPRSSSGGNIGGNTNTKKANPTEISKSSKSHNTPQSSNVHLSEALNNFLSVVKTTKITDEMTHNIISSIENTLFSNTSENQLKNDETYLQYHSPPPGGSLTDHRQIIPVDIKKTWRDVDHPIKSKMKDSPNVELTDIIATMIDENV